MHVSNLVKPPLIFLFAVSINILLFLLIHQLVTNEPGEVPEFRDLNWLDFIQLEQTIEPETKQVKETTPEEPPPEEKPPEVPAMEQPDVPKPQQPQLDIPAPNIDVPMGVNGVPYLGDYLKSTQPRQSFKPEAPDIATDLVPTTRIEPNYPPRALRAGVEGTVTVEFTITTDGSVRDIEVVKADPPDIFNNAVINAVKRWKFPPQKVDGQTVERRARQDIKFTLKR